MNEQERAELDTLLSKPLDDSDYINTPDPYELQLEIALNPAKRKVICAGRRVGKTIMAAGIAVGGDKWGNKGLLDGRKILLSSTSQDQADTFWDYITAWLSPLTSTKQAYKNEVKRVIKYRGGEIKVKTGSEPDALRSKYADLLVLDECAFLDPRAWRQVGAPLLADTNGDAIFISTPNRRNWFFELYVNANSDTSGQWKAWNFSTHSNPYITQQALNSLVSDMTDEDYQQEILAKFLEGEGAVFRRVDEVCTADIREPIGADNYIYGVDWAQSKDFTCIVVLDPRDNTVVYMDRFNGIDWALQRGRLSALITKYPPRTIWAEANSIGSPNIEALQREGLPVRSFMTTAQSKPPLIESLVLAFERGEITALNNPILKGELMAYERKVSPTTGRSQYSAPEGMHDDTVIALALAWHGVSRSAKARLIDAPFLEI